MTPIMVLGFGRSGSTWVGDVVGELAGGIMLNEPLNPCMGVYPEHLGPGSGGNYAGERLRAALAGEVEDPWLLRSYFAPLAKADHRDLGDFWDSMPIVGFKETFHAAWSIDWLVERFGRRLVYVWRDPYATIASVLARPSFWALGWPCHGEALLRAAGRSWGDARTYAERVATVWAYAHEAVLDSVGRIDFPIYNFEALEAWPDIWPGLCDHLGVAWRDVDLAKPSRTTGAPRAPLADDDRRAVARIVEPVMDRYDDYAESSTSAAAT